MHTILTVVCGDTVFFKGFTQNCDNFVWRHGLRLQRIHTCVWKDSLLQIIQGHGHTCVGNYGLICVPLHTTEIVILSLRLNCEPNGMQCDILCSYGEPPAIIVMRYVPLTVQWQTKSRYGKVSSCILFMQSELNHVT